MKTGIFLFTVFFIFKGFGQEHKVFQGELLITEIFPDPSTSQLPRKEFIEIYNNTNGNINLQDYELSDSSSRHPFPSFALGSKNFLILCKNSDTSSFKSYGLVLGLKNFITLNNSGDAISLIHKNTVVDKVSYDRNYLAGITMERVSLNTSCGNAAVWKPSISPQGGTPGKLNSFPQDMDTTELSVKSVQATKENKLIIDLGTAIDPSNSLFKVFIDKKEIPVSAISFSNNGTSVILMIQELSLYRQLLIELKDIVTCTGRLVPLVTKNFVCAKQADSLDLVINEILFDPSTGYPDFVEILNRSLEYISLDSVSIKSIKENGSEEVCKIGINPELLGPGETIAFTSDVNKLCEKYACPDRSKIIKINLPSFNNDQGTVVLCNNSLVLDRFDYSAGFHFPLLEDKEGVSLERIDANVVTNKKDSWHSAAATAGFATPGKENSNKQRLDAEGNWIVEPKAFSPNSDGYNDFSSLVYNINNPSTVATITIYNCEGLLVKKLLNNATVAAKGTIQWDGTDLDLVLVSEGHYIIKIETFTIDGQVEEFKRTVVVTSP